jgi:hypothetical protein
MCIDVTAVLHCFTAVHRGAEAVAVTAKRALLRV